MPVSTYANTRRFLNALDFESTSNAYLSEHKVSAHESCSSERPCSYIVAGSVWLLPRKPAFTPVSVLRRTSVFDFWFSEEWRIRESRT